MRKNLGVSLGSPPRGQELEINAELDAQAARFIYGAINIACDWRFGIVAREREVPLVEEVRSERREAEIVMSQRDATIYQHIALCIVKRRVVHIVEER